MKRTGWILKRILTMIAITTGVSILFLELLLCGAGEWKMRFAVFREPVGIFSTSCDMAQLKELDVVSGTVSVLYGSYSYQGISDSDVLYHYVLPIKNDNMVYYIGIKETKGREKLFRQLSERTNFDVRMTRIIMGNPYEIIENEKAEEASKDRKPFHVEGCLRRMNDWQYNNYLNWLEKAGYYGQTQQGQILPFYIDEINIDEKKADCITGLAATVAGCFLIMGSVAVIIRWRIRRRTQTHVTINGRVYAKGELQSVDRLVNDIELMQAVQRLSSITGLSMTEAEKIVRKWERYYF
jgi:hypothetical protein